MMLRDLLAEHKDERVCVVGPTCCGKSYLCKDIDGAVDMDDLLFRGGLLTLSEQAYVCQDPWTEEIGLTMSRLARERVRIAPGNPVFGTVVLDADVYVLLLVDEVVLRERAKLRHIRFADVQNMSVQLQRELAGKRVIEFLMGEQGS